MNDLAWMLLRDVTHTRRVEHCEFQGCREDVFLRGCGRCRGQFCKWHLGVHMATCGLSSGE